MSTPIQIGNMIFSFMWVSQMKRSEFLDFFSSNISTIGNSYRRGLMETNRSSYVSDSKDQSGCKIPTAANQTIHKYKSEYRRHANEAQKEILGKQNIARKHQSDDKITNLGANIERAARNCIFRLYFSELCQLLEWECDVVPHLFCGN